MKNKVLITGGAGFIGSHLIEHILKNTDWNIVSLDRLNSSGTLIRLEEVLQGLLKFERRRVKIVHHDLKAELNSHVIKSIGAVTHILHLAASSHVDKSIIDPLSFVYDNVVGTCNILNYARKLDYLELFINFSTDEIFGPAPKSVAYKEDDRYNCTNPYSAAKAGAAQLGIAFHNTYKLPVITTHTMNVFGERQDSEKYVPLCISKLLNDEKISIHSSPTGSPGLRHYLHARNASSALLFLMENGVVGEKYNIVGDKEVDNFELASTIAKILDKKLEYTFYKISCNGSYKQGFTRVIF